MAEDLPLCRHCGNHVDPPCSDEIQSYGCGLYRKTRYGEYNYMSDEDLAAEASKRNAELKAISAKKYGGEPQLRPGIDHHEDCAIRHYDGPAPCTCHELRPTYSPDVNHQETAAVSEADFAMRAYSGEPTLGPLASRLIAAPNDVENLKAVAAELDERLVAAGDAVTLPPHYTRWKIEPIFFIEENQMPFWMGNIVKYVTRADAKNGIEDLRKARRYLDMKIKQLEGNPEWSK